VVLSEEREIIGSRFSAQKYLNLIKVVEKLKINFQEK
jgi:hypothetical protein